jgi:hypothetical protein
MHAKRLTRKQLVPLFQEYGYPIGKSTLDKLCMPTTKARLWPHGGDAVLSMIPMRL